MQYLVSFLVLQSSVRIEISGCFSFMHHLCYFVCIIFLVCGLQRCGHLLGKGLPIGSFVSVFFLTFSCGVLGSVWYMIVSIPDLCLLTFLIHTYDSVTFGLRYLSTYICTQCVRRCQVIRYLFILYIVNIMITL